MLFQRGDKKDAKTKKPSILGYMFNPQLGQDVKPVGEAFSMFIYLLAAIFSSNGLFPKNHPAFSDKTGKIRLTMGEVLATAWQNVSFTKEGLPKAVIFLAVMGCIVFSALFVVTYLFSLFVPQAHAAGGMFEPTIETGGIDFGASWIDYIFRGVIYKDPMTGADAVPDSCVWISGMSMAMAFYSNAILVLAGVILLYYLVAMVAETAQYGVAMGKRANQLWAPIRLVFAIGLLVPIATAGTGGASTCSITGLNSGQYLVLQISKWGSGLASNVWKSFTEITLDPDAYASSTCSGDKGSPSCSQTKTRGRGLTHKMIRNYVCAHLYNHFIDQTYIVGLNSDNSIDIDTDSDPGTHSFEPKNRVETDKLCGGYVIPKYSDHNEYKGVYEAQQAVFGSYLESFDGVARDIYKCYVSSENADQAATSHCNIANGETISDQAQRLEDRFLEAVANATDAALRARDSDVMRGVNAGSNMGGWLGAGSWFNRLARLVSSRSESIRLGLPTSLKPAILTIRTNEDGKEKYAGHVIVETEIKSTVKALNAALVDLAKADKTMSGSFTEPEKSREARVVDKLLEGEVSTSMWDEFTGAGLVSIGYTLIYQSMKLAGTWVTDSDVSSADRNFLAVKFDPTKNIWTELMTFGQNLIQTSNYIYTAAGALYIGSFFTVAGSGLGAGAIAFAGFLVTLGTILLTPGVLLAFVVPMFPFFRFFFGAMTWMIGVAEAIMAVPLWALAHVNPEGDGLPGGKAMRGYYLILQIFLRPSLMILGLIISYLLFVTSISFLNYAFVAATVGSGAMGGLEIGSALPMIIYSVMYCALVYTCANVSFKAIGMLPQHALTWVGSSPAHQENMGNPAVAGFVGGLVGGQMLQGIMQSPGNIAKSLKDRKDKKETDDKTTKASTDNHNALLGALGGGKGAGESGATEGSGQSGSSESGGGGGGGTQVSNAAHNPSLIEKDDAGLSKRDSEVYKAEGGSNILRDTFAEQQYDKRKNDEKPRVDPSSRKGGTKPSVSDSLEDIRNQYRNENPDKFPGK